MHPVRQRRLIFFLLLLVASGIAVALVLYALGQNLNAFYTPSQVKENKVTVQQMLRVGGMVEKGSVKRLKDKLKVQFAVTDFKQRLVVVYRGVLPDLFREGQGVVVQGKLGANGVLQASQVLAKHDENYMPPSIKKAMGNSNVT